MGTTAERMTPRYTLRANSRGAVTFGLTGLVVLATPGPSLGKDEDCKNFKTQKRAKRFFKRHKPSDPHHLYGDHDGKACEDLP
jgi:hypothetical protein